MPKPKTMFLFKVATLSGLCGLFIMLQTGCSTIHSPPIVENDTGIHHLGKFVWHDLLTSDVAATKTFYGQLFNWVFEQHDRYTLISVDNKHIGGIVYSPEDSSSRHAAHWLSFLSVPDVDQAIDVVTANGGTVLKGPETIKGRGRVASISDPQGARLSLIFTQTSEPNDGPIAEGAWLWHELWTNNPSDSAKFYEALVGYSTVEIFDDYWVLSNDNKWQAGVRNLFNKSLEQRWVPVVKVNDVKAISARAKHLGGKVIIAPENPDFVDQIALLADPLGALFIIQEWSGEDDSEKGEKQE